MTNSTTSFFETKEQYASFRQSWKDFHKAKKHLKVEKTAYDGTKYKSSDLVCEHHLIYAILRGREPGLNFTPTSKVQGQEPYHTFITAKNNIKFATNTSFPANHEYLLAPFGGTVTFDMLSKIDFGSVIV